MTKYFITLIILIPAVLLLHPYTQKSAMVNLLSTLAVGGIGTVIGAAITAGYNLKSKLWVILKARLRYPNTYIRVSAAYIFKINVDGKYLLVKGRNIDQFQPVGGVYKRLSQSDKLFIELEILDDKEIPISETTKSDLRIRIKGKHLYKFIHWFESGEDREISHWREFCEELIQPGHLTATNFPHINYRYLHQNPFYIHYSSYYQCPEILIHQVYELIPTEKQLLELKDLTADSHTEYQWVDEETITRLGRKDGYKPFAIAEHSNTLFNKEYRLN